VCRLYTSENDNWEYSGKCGAMFLLADSNLKTHFLRLLDTSSGNMLFEQEFYDNFSYSTLNDWLHIFENDKSVIGLSFADEQEAKEFLNCVNQCKSGFKEDNSKKQPQKNSKSKDGKKKKKDLVLKKYLKGAKRIPQLLLEALKTLDMPVISDGVLMVSVLPTYLMNGKIYLRKLELKNLI